jgi:hypothetical protein
MTRALVSLVSLAIVWLMQAPAVGQQATALRTPDGQPDLQGIWDYRSATPLERPAQFAGKEFMTPEEVKEYERRAIEREDGRPPDDRPHNSPAVRQSNPY